MDTGNESAADSCINTKHRLYLKLLPTPIGQNQKGKKPSTDRCMPIKDKKISEDDLY